MTKDCGHFFLTSTAREIWRSKDNRGENNMYECLYEIREEKFFPRVIYPGGKVTNDRKAELAEDAFHLAWEAFNTQGKAGLNKTEDVTYIWYFFGILWHIFRGLFKLELRKMEGEEGFNNTQPGDDLVADEIHKHGMDLPEIQAALGMVSANCQELLVWRFKNGLSHDAIAQKKNIQRDACIQMVARCKRRFLEIWRGTRNDFN